MAVGVGVVVDVELAHGILVLHHAPELLLHFLVSLFGLCFHALDLVLHLRESVCELVQLSGVEGVHHVQHAFLRYALLVQVEAHRGL